MTTGELTLTFGLVKPAELDGGVDEFWAGLLAPLVVGGFELTKVALVLPPELFFHSNRNTPRAIANTATMIMNGRFRFIRIRNAPRRAAFRDRRRLRSA